MGTETVAREWECWNIRGDAAQLMQPVMREPLRGHVIAEAGERDELVPTKAGGTAARAQYNAMLTGVYQGVERDRCHDSRGADRVVTLVGP